MTCIVCHRSIGTRAKKCSVCGAPTALGKGNVLFEMDTADKNQLKKYYEQCQLHETEQKAAVQAEVGVEIVEEVHSVSQAKPNSYVYQAPLYQHEEVKNNTAGKILLGITLAIQIIAAIMLLLPFSNLWLVSMGLWFVATAGGTGATLGAWEGNQMIALAFIIPSAIIYFIVLFLCF